VLQGEDHRVRIQVLKKLIKNQPQIFFYFNWKARDFLQTKQITTSYTHAREIDIKLSLGYVTALDRKQTIQNLIK